MYVYLCVSICTHMQCQSLEESIRPGPHQEQYSVLATEPFFQPQDLHLTWVCILFGFPGSGIEESGRKYLLNNAVFDFIIFINQSTCKSNVQIKSLFSQGREKWKVNKDLNKSNMATFLNFKVFHFSLLCSNSWYWLNSILHLYPVLLNIPH